MKGNIDEFNVYLLSQVGQPYVWGGQHLRLTPDNYVEVITRKESDETYRKQAISFCKNLFDKGATVLYAYDCSGLGMYWLQNVKGIFKNDMSAASMYTNCKIVTESPKNGYWLFRMSGNKATHIGFMISDTEVVHAKGRSYGVVKENYSKTKKYWHKIGIPKCMAFDSVPVPTPTPPNQKTHLYIRVKRKSVNVRKGNGTLTPVLFTAHLGDEFPCYGQADQNPHWYMIKAKGQDAYITSNSRYTEEVYKV